MEEFKRISNLEVELETAGQISHVRAIAQFKGNLKAAITMRVPIDAQPDSNAELQNKILMLEQQALQKDQSWRQMKKEYGIFTQRITELEDTLSKNKQEAKEQDKRRAARI